MKAFILTLLLASNISYATSLIPSDYEDNQVFFKVEKSEARSRVNYKFYECVGDQESAECDVIFSEDGYSKTELNSLETRESVKGGFLLAAEIVTGGIIWKRLMKFTLGGAARMTARATGWREGVANGTVALAVTAPLNTAVTYYAFKEANDLLEVIDPISKFRKSELVDTDEYDEVGDGVIALGYNYQEVYVILDELLSRVH
ncbi:hypothetical protein [Halobacteriovorax sp.]|uniref:hypothetical protein n=1 Tax=Halobacteriovorax sp. TaxID=2020862 RepID=UPI003561D99C